MKFYRFWAVMCDQLVLKGHGDIQAWAAVEGHVLVHSPTEVRVGVDTHGTS